jgi:hypothetical protein
MLSTLLQVPDEEDLLKRRLRAEQRKLQAIQSTTLEAIKEESLDSIPSEIISIAGQPYTNGAVKRFTPVTLIFQDLHYYVPNPAAASSGTADARSSRKKAAAAAAAAGGGENVAAITTSTRQSTMGDQAAAKQQTVPAVGPTRQQEATDSDIPAELELLKGLTAFAEPGRLLALMGGSGGGLELVEMCPHY